MSVAAQSDPWTIARHSMQSLDLSVDHMSRGWFVGIFALGSSAVLLILLGVGLNLNLNRLIDSLAWAQHSNDILLRLGQMERGLAQSESSARAYALASDRTYLNVLSRSHRSVDRNLDALHGLVSDNPVQTRRLDAARPLIGARLSFLEWFVRLGPAAGRAMAVSGDRAAADLRRDQRRLVARIDGRVAIFRTREIELLSSRQVLAQHDTETLDYLAIAAAVSAAASGAFGIYLLIREGQNARARALQMEVMHMQRLGVMGQNTATLAHEINQPLTAAANYAGVLKRLLAAPGNLDREKLRDITQRIARQIERTAAIVKRLRAFFEKRDGEKIIEHPGTLAEDAVALFATFDDSAELTTTVADGLPDILVDRVQIQQVLVNLMRNGLQAMQGRPDRALHLTVCLANPDSIQFCLRDTGPGLSKAVADRLFQPFVSTTQDGMGVGLSICRRILEDHGGRIWAESRAGEGAAFFFVIPAVHAGQLDLAA